MKKLALGLFFFVLIANTAYAGSCPMLWGEVDSKLNKIKNLEMLEKKHMTAVITQSQKSF